MVTTERNNDFIEQEIMERLQGLAPLTAYQKEVINEILSKDFVKAQGGVMSNPLKDIKVTHKIDWGVRNVFNPNGTNEDGRCDNLSWLQIFIMTLTNENITIGLAIFFIIARFLYPNRTFSALYFIIVSSIFLQMIKNGGKGPENEPVNEDVIPIVVNLWDNAKDDFDKYQNNSEEDIEMSSVEAQSGGSGIDTIAESLLFLLSLGIGYKPRNGALLGIKEFLRHNDTTRGNMVSTVVLAYGKLEELFKTFNCTKSLSKYFEIPVEDDRIRVWIESVHSFVDNVSTCRYSGYEENTIQYQTLIQRYDELVKEMGKSRSFNFLALKKAHDMLEDCRTSFERRFKSLRGFRPEPVMVFFHGEPGVMKSTLCDQLADMLNDLTLTDEAHDDYCRHPGEYVYRRSTDKWWEGYTSKANVVIIDDLFQLVDNGSTPNESEAALIIRMINSEEFAVPMAQADNKNGTFFRSNFVLASSNVYNTGLANSIHDKTALDRRLHFKINIRLKDRYVNDNGKLNVGNLSNLLDANGDPIPDAPILNYDMWEFSVTETRGATQGAVEVLDYPDLVERLVKRHYQHLKYHEVNRATSAMMKGLMRESILVRLEKSKRELERVRITTNHDEVIPQSGIPGGFPSQWREKSKFKVEMKPSSTIRATISWADTSRLLMIVTAWNEVHYADGNRVWMWSGFDTFYRFVDSLSPEQGIVLAEFIGEIVNSDSDVEAKETARKGLKSVLTSIVLQRNSKGLDILTGDKLEFEASPDSKKMKFFESGRKVLTLIQENMPLFVAGVGIAGLGVYYFAKSFKYSIDPQSGTPERYMRGPNRGTERTVRTPNVRREERPNVKPQGISDLDNQWTVSKASFNFGTRDALSDIMKAVVDKYLYVMWMVDENVSPPAVHRLGHAINVKGRYMLTFFHAIYVLEDRIKGKDESKIYIRFNTPSNVRKFSRYVRDVLKFAVFSKESMENDYCLLECGNEPNAKGCLDFFIKENDISWKRRSRIPISITGFHQTGEEHKTVIFRSHNTEAILRQEPIEVAKDWDNAGPLKYHLYDVLEYSGSFGGGDCGSIINLRSPTKGPQVLLGLHVAGSKRIGYSSIICREYIERLMECEPNDDSAFLDEIEPQGLSRETIILLNQENDKIPSGVFDPPHTVPTCLKSDIVKSELFGKLPKPYDKVGNYPAKLGPFVREGKIYNPKDIALSNYGRELAPIDLGFLNLARKSYYDLIVEHSTMTYDSRIVYGTEEVLGAFGENIKSIKSDTSAGWPMNTASTENIKSLYFEALHNGDDKLRLHYLGEIEKMVLEAELDLKNGIRPAFVYSDALKDETRPLSKVFEGKTRMFSGCPFVLLILFRKYFGAFQDEFFHLNLKIGSAIGINPYSEQWDELAQRLLRYTKDPSVPSIGAGDYSKFDCSEQPEILQEVCTIINWWYGPSEATLIRKRLWSEITHSRHVFGKEFFEWCNGMPSGNPMTAIINTMYNQLAFRMCWCYTPSFMDVGMDRFNTMVYMCALGDDNIFSVSPLMRDEFNEIFLAETMPKIGLTYTTESKGVAVVPFRRITEVDFLKRSFKQFKVNGTPRWFAPIQLTTITEMLNWTKRGYMADQITVDNINVALRELSLHGKSTFDYWQPILTRLRLEYLPGLTPQGGSYCDWADTFREVANMDHSL